MSLQFVSRSRAILVLASLVGLIAALHLASRFGLNGPAHLNRDGLSDWLGQPLLVVATVARWLSLVLAYYLAVVIGAVVLFGERIETTGFAKFSPSTMTSIVGLLLGASAVVIPIASSAALRPSDPTHAPADHKPSEPLSLRRMDSPLTLRDAEQATEPERTQVWSQTWSVVAQPTSTQGPNDEWTVEPGDSFWSIAQETLYDNSPHSKPSDETIAIYWRTLIEVNEDSLIDPGNPDLLLPGQLLRLPPVS